MFADSEAELREIIIQNLESCGFLNKIKAQLRSGVFLAIEENDSLRSKCPLFNKKLDEFVETKEGKLAVSIVREFLEFFELKYTLSVFEPEIASSSQCYSRKELSEKFNIKNDTASPILLNLLKFATKSTGSANFITNSSKPLNTITENAVEEKCKNQADDTSCIDLKINLKERGTSKEAVTASGTEMIQRLFNDPSIEKDKNISDILANDATLSSIFKVKTSNAQPDSDPFFDDPLPSEKSNFFGLTELPKPSKNLPSLNIPSKKCLPVIEKSNNSVNKASSDELHKPENSESTGEMSLKNKIETKSVNEPSSNALSSLKDLPSLTSTSSKWNFSKEKAKVENEKTSKSQSELSSQEDSISEDIEEDLSAGLDDILNNSLEECTTDQSISQASIVDGVDHIENV